MLVVLQLSLDENLAMKDFSRWRLRLSARVQCASRAEAS